MLTISQLASYAGVTVRAVRHYHSKGLLPEPERDHSGYRRYDAAAVVELVKIRTLAEAGVPLSRVRELLAAGDDEFVAAVDDIDRRLRAEIRARQRHREQIAKLASGDSLALPPEAVAYLTRLRSVGVPEEMVEAERDAWILVAAQIPERMAFYMETKERQLDDPDVRELYRDLHEITRWSADDPRLDQAAERLAEQFEQVPDDAWDEEKLPEDLAELLDGVFLSSVPGARRLLTRLEQLGWTGWTNIQRIDTERTNIQRIDTERIDTGR
jgi:DNA-binding transcriptional MerR regulator